jgi:myo-inositol-1(or 4)-monophosphatase
MEERLKSAIISATQQAGFYLKNPNGSKKTPAEVEKRCRDTLLRGIRNADPTLSLWGEERETPERAVAICPLDSSLNFARGLGAYGVMAAYIEESRPVLGALFFPESGIMISAERGKGARIDGRKTSVSMRSELSSALVCCSCDGYMQDVRSVVPVALGVIQVLAENGIQWRNSGSPSADYAAVASGKADALVAPMQESAHAAGYLIMEEAGAQVTDRSGNRFTLHSQGVVAANPDLHGPLLELLQGSLG